MKQKIINIYLFFKLQYSKIIAQYFVKPEDVPTVDKKYLQIATFFGCGYFKKAPGTFTSFITLIIGLILVKISATLLLIVICVVIVIGLISCEKILTHTKDNQDPSYITIDEVAGQLIPFLILGYHSFIANILNAILIFVIFRALDIYKPWIIGYSEKAFKGSLGVMIDDILAGIFTLFIAFIILLIV